MIFTPNNSIYLDGQIKLFSIKDFVSIICLENNCFICGASHSDKTFNEEHVLPNWILRKFNLHSKKITLTCKPVIFNPLLMS